MNRLTLIPFALRLEDNQLVDVSAVEKGIQCGCICPSCKTTLIARKGEVNEWHFAHASRGASESTENGCEFSLWVSVTLMAKQIIYAANSINLPSLKMAKYSGGYREEIPIAKQQIVNINKVELERRVSEVYADAVLSIGEYFIAVIFATPQRKLADTEYAKMDNIGVLEISLAEADIWLFSRKINGEYSKVISQYVIDEVKNKRWLHHPRRKILEEQYRTKFLSLPSSTW